MDSNMTIALYRKLDSYLKSLITGAPLSLKLERITHLLDLLGNPHNSFPSIHVAGTSGKGSTSIMLASILSEFGYKSGLFLSPYLQILNESYQINNRLVATSRLAEVFENIKPAIEQVAEENPFGRPSIFEAQVALAFCLFQQENVDVAVIEVGLGGTLDATNVIQAQVAVLTSIGLDHTEYLGKTIEEITHAKAGIVKPNQIVISGLTQPSTQQIVADRCTSQGATLWQQGQAFTHNIEDNSDRFKVVCPDKTYSNIHLGMQGDFQIINAACAIAAAHAFTKGISESIVHDALKQLFIPGRFECIQKNPTVILDGAHNLDKIRAASGAINKYYATKRKIIVLALKSDKDPYDILPYVLESASVLIVTAFKIGQWEPFKPESLAQLASEYFPHLDIRIEANPTDAIELALLEAKAEDLIWVTGSLYLVGDVREHWYPSEDLIIQLEQPTDIK